MKLNRLSVIARGLHVEKKLKDLGVVIPVRPLPKGNYINCIRVGNMLHVCGHITQNYDGALIKGRLGESLSVKEGYDTSRMVGLNMCSSLQSELGTLDRVKRVVRILGFVNCVDSFTQHDEVVDGFSDLMNEIFGEKGIHARTVVGNHVLPLDIPVEIEAIVEIESD